MEQLRPCGLILLCLIWMSNSLLAQQIVTISQLKDRQGEEYDSEIRKELEALLGNTYDLEFNVVGLSELSNAGGLKAIYDRSDIVISTGFNVSFLVTNQAELSKPTIIPFVFNNKLQNIPPPVAGTSGIKNLSYIESPFDLRRDFATLESLHPYQKIAIVGDGNVQVNDPSVINYLKSLLPAGRDFQLYAMEPTADRMIEKLADCDAVFFFPINDASSPAMLQELFTSLADQGKVTFSISTQPFLDLGVYAAYESDANFGRIPRRVALNVMKILEGQAPATLKVTMPTQAHDLLINMAAVNRSGVYPSFDMLNTATLYNLTATDSNEEGLSLRAAIAEALQNNLQLSAAQRQVAMGEKDISIAKSNLLPQIDGSASVYQLDEGRTIFQGQGTLGAYNINAAADLTQVLLSEPALANITIQKLLNESNKQALRINELDVVQNVTNAYVGILQTKALVELNNDNLNVTRQNFNIAKNKQSVGQSGASDVYRWESQLALQNVELNNALAQLTQARQGLNFLLNRPTESIYPIADVDVDNAGMLVNDMRFVENLNSHEQVHLLGEFLAREARHNLPEVKQIEASIQATERNLLSQKRAYYLPQVALTANLTQPLGHYDVPESVMRVDNVPRQYQVAVGVQLPIFKGWSRKHNQAKTEVQLLQLADNKELLQDNLELNVRNAMILASTSYRNRELTAEAAASAARNFELAQESYNEGLLNITSLIDAQNALLQSRINATNAEYVFLRDFIALERTYGKYYFLLSPAEKDAYYNRFVQYITSGQSK